MKQFCPKCYSKSFVTVALQELKNGEWVCTADASHRFTLDKEGYPRTKKL